MSRGHGRTRSGTFGALSGEGQEVLQEAEVYEGALFRLRG